TRLLATGGEARLRFAERGETCGIASSIALGVGMLVACGIGLVLALAPVRARRGFGRRRGGNVRLRRFGGRALALDIAAHRLQLRFDVGEPVLAGEAARRTGRRIGGDREAV